MAKQSWVSKMNIKYQQSDKKTNKNDDSDKIIKKKYQHWSAFFAEQNY